MIETILLKCRAIFLFFRLWSIQIIQNNLNAGILPDEAHPFHWTLCYILLAHIVHIILLLISKQLNNNKQMFVMKSGRGSYVRIPIFI